MAELADAMDLKSSVLWDVWVRPPLFAPYGVGWNADALRLERNGRNTVQVRLLYPVPKFVLLAETE